MTRKEAVELLERYTKFINNHYSTVDWGPSVPVAECTKAFMDTLWARKNIEFNNIAILPVGKLSDNSR
jgi:hypothetical protein